MDFPADLANKDRGRYDGGPRFFRIFLLPRSKDSASLRRSS